LIIRFFCIITDEESGKLYRSKNQEVEEIVASKIVDVDVQASINNHAN
jgi:hypothetical protein